VFSGMLGLAIFVIIIDTAMSAIENRLMVWRPAPAASQH
jgi:NitT/TauT family transport system permease protein